jgi:hypothetical protein
MPEDLLLMGILNGYNLSERKVDNDDGGWQDQKKKCDKEKRVNKSQCGLDL